MELPVFANELFNMTVVLLYLAVEPKGQMSSRWVTHNVTEVQKWPNLSKVSDTNAIDRERNLWNVNKVIKSFLEISFAFVQ
jgi:hypothetical protein